METCGNDSLKRYNPLLCSKCGTISEDIIINYVQQISTAYTSELFACKCSHCGFSWIENISAEGRMKSNEE
jgi:DNA-directed RNA polymerase subunit M/transcription elongation factor TFIIS